MSGKHVHRDLEAAIATNAADVAALAQRVDGLAAQHDTDAATFAEALTELLDRVTALEAPPIDPPGPPPLTVVTDPTGRLLVTQPTTFDRVRFECRVEVRAPGVRFTACEFVGTPDKAPANSALLFVPASFGGDAAATGCTFAPQFPCDTLDGVRGSGATLVDCDISGTVDGVHIHGARGDDPKAGRVLIDACHIHDLHRDPTSPSHSDGTHNDCVQIANGTDITIRNSRLGDAFTAQILATQGFGTVRRVTITGNHLGAAPASVNINDGGTAIPGLSITGNTFAKGSPGWAMLVTEPTKSAATVSGNVWDDGSTPGPVVKRG